MPIDIVYEDPEALGAAAYDAARNRQRRKNIELTLAQQLEADKANAQIGIQEERVNLDAAQLYEGLRQRDTDRRAQLEEAERNRAHDAGQLERRHRLGTDAALEMAGVNQANDLGRIEAMSTARREELKFQLDENKRREVAARRAEIKSRLDEPNLRQYEQLERDMKALKKGLKNGDWASADDPFYQQARATIQEEMDGILRQAPPKQKPLGPLDQKIADGTAQREPDGTVWETLPNGTLKPHYAKNDPAAAIRKEFDDARKELIADRDRAYAAELEDWKHARDNADVMVPPPRPKLKPAPTDAEVRAYAAARRKSVADEMNGATPGEGAKKQPGATYPAAGEQQPPESLTPDQAQAEKDTLGEKHGYDTTKWPPEAQARLTELKDGQQKRQARVELRELRKKDPKDRTKEEAMRAMELMKQLGVLT